MKITSSTSNIFNQVCALDDSEDSKIIIYSSCSHTPGGSEAEVDKQNDLDSHF